MSNKITLATIQFRADTKGVNPALDAMRQSSKDAHDEVDRLQEALDKGIKKMKDANGVEFDVADKFRQAQKAAKSYDQALRELVKGATALEAVVQNIRLGEIEKSSRAELKGAINAAEARKRSVRESDPEDLEQQRELNQVIEESRKQLNNLDRDTQKVIETLDKGGVIAQATLDKEIKGLKEILTLIPKGTDEWNKYNQQLTQMEAHVANIRRQEREAAVSVLGSKDFGRYSEEDIRTAITNARELLATYKTASPEAKALADNIVRADQYLKEHGIEAARQAAREKEQLQLEQELAKTMNKRLRDLKNLSADALVETHKYWEAQKNGAAEGTTEFNKAESALKKIDGYQRNARRTELGNILGDPSKFGVSEVKAAVQEAEKLRDSVQKGIPVWFQYNKMVEQGREYLDRLAKSEAAEHISQQMNNLSSLSASGLQEVKKYWETMVAGAAQGSAELRQYEDELKRVVTEEQKRKKDSLFGDAQKVFGDRSTMSEQELRRAVEAAKEYQQTLTASGTLHQQYSRAIAETEEYLKQYSVETERAKVKQEALDKQMRNRMADLPKLSESALQETKKYWEDLMRTEGLAEQKLSSYRIQLEKLIAEERRRKEVQAERVIGNLNTSSDEEIRRAIQAFEQLRDAQAHGNDEWRYYNERVQEGKKYLDEWAQTDKVVKFEEQMQNLPSLSDAALTETKKFWETMVAGAEKGSSELREYEAHLEKVKQEEQERKELSNEMKAQLVRTGTLGNFSESEIKESIAAAKELQSHMASASPKAKKLADAIANAEEHIKKYGIESARAAKRQQESDDTMRKQLSRMSEDFLHGNGMPSEAALKAQKRYWQQLIDDPKNAGKSLQQYRDSLAEVEKLMADMVKINGQTALEWFRNGSDKNSDANKIKEMADRLKAYRDTLPQESEAATIQYIDQLLQKVGASTKKATAELMDFEKAKEIALQAGDDVYGKQNPAFLASPEEIQAATKSIEKYREELFKTIKQKRDMGEATDAEEEELKELAKYLKDLKFEQDNFNMSRENMEQLMNQPVSAVSIDELRAAIKRADAELRRMEGSLGENSSEYKRFAEQVRNAKNVMKEMEGQAKASATAWEKAFSRLKTYVVMYMGFNEVWQKVTGTARDLMDLSDKMGEVRKTTGFTADEVGRLSENLKKMDVRTSLTSLMEISASAGQLGLKTLEDVQGFTEAANKLMIALPEMGREAATEMMRVAIATGEVDKIRKQLQEGTIEGSSATAVAMEKIASTIDRLRASSASTAPEITDFVKRVGAVGAQSGITIDQVAALGSTVSSLGMRVEMSATALSRMIPAIRNNAYEIGSMIGKTEEEIVSKFDRGLGMEVILDIFDTIRRNSATMTGDVEHDAEQVEKVFEKAGMQDIMKELNQMGARAGIVFAGLSQNVDELRRQLGIAADAYEENIAIELEFQKMNETTAAKWERLKNAFEEAFVGDGVQRFLGNVIDGLRKIVDLLMGDNGVSGALWTIVTYMSVLRLKIADIVVGGITSLVTGIKNIGLAIAGVKGQLTALQTTNIFLALAAAATYAAYRLGVFGKEAGFVDIELAKADKAIADATEKLDRMFIRLDKTTTALDRATEATLQAKEGSEQAAEAQDKLAIATENHKRMIDAINSNYASYLGFMLTEYDRAEMISAAHDKITAALKREMYVRQQQQSLQAVQDEYNPKILDEWANTRKEMREKGVNSEVISDTFEKLQNILDSTKWNPNTGGYNIEGEAWQELTNTLGEETVKAARSIDELMAQYMYKHLAGLTDLTAEQLQDITGVLGLKSTDQGNVASRGAENGFVSIADGDLHNNLRQGLMNVYTDFIQKRDEVTDIFNHSIGRWATEEREKS